MEAVWSVGHLAWQHHPGRFADGSLENPVLRLKIANLSSSRGSVPAILKQKRSSPGTLHVATTIYPTGGHTRVLANWLLHDSGGIPGIVLTNQTAPCPDFFEQAVVQAQGWMTQLPLSEPMAMRAARLREISRQFKRVVLHTHPNDPIPIAAFSASGGPPVAMFNHAHFNFCLGPTVSDVIINTMKHFRGVTDKFRFPRNTYILPSIPGMFQAGSAPINKQDAKRKLGLNETEPLVMSIGSERYFKPAAGYDFFQTISKLLDAHPSINVVVVGVRQNCQFIPAGLRNRIRFRCVGPVLDPVPYYQAADICLESFPMPSLGGLLEAAIHGEAFPIPVYGLNECILRVSHAPTFTCSYRPKDENDYLNYIVHLLNSPSETREQARSIRFSITQFHKECSQGVVELNRLIDGLKHAPCEIPCTTLDDSYDSQILADLNSDNFPTNCLPYGQAVRLQFLAAARGIITTKMAAFETARRPYTALKRRLRKRPTSST